RKYHYETAIKYAVQIVERVADQGIPDGILLNVNIPNLEVSDVQGVKVTRQDLGTYSANAIERKDRTGNPYYWIGGDRLATDQRPDTDLNTLKNRFVSITPVQLDQTAYDHLDMVKDWFNC
ncbi:TPA: 5'/3'-nucleotidase SurE, partial [Candidatus Poribacteria bacterium]|nr:5'/3'-nucleotidase SurE [Candidatus Poribacteria bacterium]